MSKAATALEMFRMDGAGAVMERIGEIVRPHLVIDESHIWYQQDLTQVDANPVIPDGLTVRAGDENDLALVERLPTIGREDAKRRLASGATPWFVLEGGEPLFACWVFRTSAPVIAARDGRLLLAEHIVMLEDSVTAEAARGRGIAPLGWKAIAHAEHEAGARTAVTKIAVDNVPSRKAILKAGFKPMGIVRFHRVGGRGGRTEMFPLDTSAATVWLAEALAAKHPFLTGPSGTLL